MSSELDSWSEASGEPGDPSAMSRQHLRRAIKHILKSYEFSDLGSGRGEPDRTIGRIWDKSQADPGAVAEAFGSAILEGIFSIGYVMTRLNGGRHQPAAGSSGTPTPSHDREEGSDPTRAEEPETAPLPVEDSDPVGNFILMNRSLRHHPFFKTHPMWAKAFWSDLLMDAAYYDHEISYMGRPIFLKRGQWIVSCRRIAREYRVSERMVYYYLNLLKAQKMIDFSPVFWRPNESISWRVTGSVTGNVTGSVTGGTLVTILNYNRFQVNFVSDVTGSVTGSVTHTNKSITKKGEPKNVLPPKPPSVKVEEILKAYEENHGALQSYGGFLMSVGNRKHAQEILSGLTEVCQTPEAALEKWVEVIKYAAANVDESNRWFIDMKWFAKDIDNCRKVLEGKFNHPFGRGEDHGARKRSGEGNFENFGRKGKGQERQSRETVDSIIQRRPSTVQRVPGHGMDLCGGLPGGKTCETVPVCDRESGEGNDSASDPTEVPGGGPSKH